MLKLILRDPTLYLISHSYIPLSEINGQKSVGNQTDFEISYMISAM